MLNFLYAIIQSSLLNNSQVLSRVCAIDHVKKPRGDQQTRNIALYQSKNSLGVR